MYERNFHRLLGIQYKIQLKFYVDQLFEHCKKFLFTFRIRWKPNSFYSILIQTYKPTSGGNDEYCFLFVLIQTFCFSKVENRMGFIFLLRNVWTIKNNNHIYSLDVVVGDKREIRPHNCLINQQWQQQTEWEKKTSYGWQYKHIQNNNTAIIRSGNWKRASVHNNKWMKENKRSEDKNEKEKRLF